MHPKSSRPRRYVVTLDRAYQVIAAREVPVNEIILRVSIEQLRRTGGSVTRAAKLLGFNRRTLQRNLKSGFKRRRSKTRGKRSHRRRG